MRMYINMNEIAYKSENIAWLYWYWIHERMNVFYKKALWHARPYSQDPIFNQQKFCNAYRFLDRTSQYLLKIQAESKPEDWIFRTLLFKLFNKIETWELLEKKFWYLSEAEFDVDKYSLYMEELKSKGVILFNSAYVMNPGWAKNKSLRYLQTLREMLDRKQELLAISNSQEKVCKWLETYPAIAWFISFQLSTDLSYLPEFNFLDEQTFVIAWPWAKRWIEKVFNDTWNSHEELIVWCYRNQINEIIKYCWDNNLLPWYPLQLIDVQNTFCEFDKYTRNFRQWDFDINGHDLPKRIREFIESTREKILYISPNKSGVDMDEILRSKAKQYWKPEPKLVQWKLI